MRVFTIATGDELLMGDGRDSNFHYLAHQITQLGAEIVGHKIVGDDIHELHHAFSDAFLRCDCLIVTGGLGPTTDDLTREAMALAIGRSIYIDGRISKRLRKRYPFHSVPSAIDKQAMFIRGSQVLENTIGTAPGMYVHCSKNIFLLPGPPHEMIPMFEKHVRPKLKKWVMNRRYHHRIVRTYGLQESSIQEKIHSFDLRKHTTKIGYVSSREGVDIRMRCRKGDKKISRLTLQIRSSLKDYIYAEGKKDLAFVVLELLRKKRRSIAIAESCTGGLLCKRLTSFPGASKTLFFGAVVYSDKAKQDVLGVRRQSLKTHGAVSKQVALTLARNVRLKGGTDIGLAITGIAGPTGGCLRKSVGTVFLAIDTNHQVWCKKFQFKGDRVTIQFCSTQMMLDVLRRHVLGLEMP